MSNANMFLWWGSGSAPCWKPMIVLAEKGLWKDCPNKLIEFSKKEHKGEDVMKLNPRGQAPTFKDGEVVVNESGAICMYLEDNYKTGNVLIPADPKTRALCYQKMFETSNVMSNIMLPLLYYKMRTKKEDWVQATIDEGVAKANDELKFWEASLAGKTFLAGDVFTMADVFFYPFVATIKRQGGKLADFPNLNKYYECVSERPSIKETAPPHWASSPSPCQLAEL